MRKLIYSINLTIDGCLDHTKGKPGEEVHDFYTDLLRTAGLLVYGRVTYELMVPFWPDIARNDSGPTRSMNDFAHAFDALDRIVFSRTLEKVEDKKTRLVRTDPGEEILRLKQEPGKDMLLGGVALPSQLIKQGLVDEYIFVVHPVIAGEGRRLMEGTGLKESLPLELTGSKNIGGGFMALYYK